MDIVCAKKILTSFARTQLSYPSRYCLHSDNEEDRGRSSYNGQSGKDFKDEEETVTTKSVHIVQATETTATRKRGGVPSRKVDLGAAANFTGDKSPSTSNKQVTRAHMSMQERLYWYAYSYICTAPWSFCICSLFQPQPAAPQPSSTGLADLLMVDTTPSQPAATGIMSLTSSNALTFGEMCLFAVLPGVSWE